MDLNKKKIIENLEIVGELKGLNINKAVCLVDCSDEAHWEADIEKAADYLKVNKETVLDLDMKALVGYKTKFALYLDSMLTATKRGDLKWYRVATEPYAAVKNGRNVDVCDLPMIDVETGLFTSPATGATFDFRGNVVIAELKNGYHIINIIYQKPSLIPATINVMDSLCSNLPKQTNEEFDVFHEIVLWDKINDTAHSVYCSVEGKDGDLGMYLKKFSDYVIEAAKNTYFCTPVDLVMDDVLGL